MNAIELLRKEAEKRGLLQKQSYDKYKTDPVAYFREVLGVEPTPQQEEVANALVKYKRVLVNSAHSQGKSLLGAWLICWMYDCYQDSITFSTAPTLSQVTDVLWKYVRKYRTEGILPKAPRMESGPTHFAVGFTSNTGTSFQGRHSENMLGIFDESVGIGDEYFDAAEGMLTSANSLWLLIHNPTTTDSRTYREMKTGKWHVITLSGIDHPNVIAHRENKPIPFPGAITWDWINDKVEKWCEPNEDGDFEWEGKRYKTGPLFQSRVLGTFPTSQTNNVWSEKDLQNLYIEQEKTGIITIGVDIACMGEDSTAIVIKDGPVIVDIIERNGLELSEIAGLVKSLLDNYSKEPKKARVYYDSAGIGYGFKEFADGYNFIAVNNAEKADSEEYPNKRSEGWFTSKGNYIPDINLREELINQLRTPSYKLNSKGQLLVESKDITRKTLKRSPDLADAYCLACRNETSWFDKYGVLYK